jgi:hypothetical protein
VCFLLRYTAWPGVLDLDRCYDALTYSLSPLSGTLARNDSDYQHIASVGAGNVLTPIDFGLAIINRCPGCFNNGFVSGVHPKLEALQTKPPMLVPCLRDPSRLQVNAVQLSGVADLAAAAGHPEQTEELQGIFNTGQMENSQVQTEFEHRAPTLADIADVWQTTQLKTLTLTSKGIALGYTYWQRLTSSTAELSVWLPD